MSNVGLLNVVLHHRHMGGKLGYQDTPASRNRARQFREFAQGGYLGKYYELEISKK